MTKSDFGNFCRRKQHVIVVKLLGIEINDELNLNSFLRLKNYLVLQGKIVILNTLILSNLTPFRSFGYISFDP